MIGCNSFDHHSTPTFPIVFATAIPKSLNRLPSFSIAVFINNIFLLSFGPHWPSDQPPDCVPERCASSPKRFGNLPFSTIGEIFFESVQLSPGTSVPKSTCDLSTCPQPHCHHTVAQSEHPHGCGGFAAVRSPSVFLFPSPFPFLSTVDSLAPSTAYARHFVLSANVAFFRKSSLHHQPSLWQSCPRHSRDCAIPICVLPPCVILRINIRSFSTCSMPPSGTSPSENLLQGIDHYIGSLITNPSRSSRHAIFLDASQYLVLYLTHVSSVPLLKRKRRSIVFVSHRSILSKVLMVHDQFSLPKETPLRADNPPVKSNNTSKQITTYHNQSTNIDWTKPYELQESPLTRLCEAVAGALIQPLRINSQQVGFARSFKAGIRDAILFCILVFVATPWSGAPFVLHQKLNTLGSEFRSQQALSF